MKTTLVRAAVLSIVFAGFSASTIASIAHKDAATKIAVKGGPSTMPTPACGPHDPTHCGADQF